MKIAKYDQEKSLAVIQFVISKLGGTLNLHKLFKILYFAEEKHLSRYGREILEGDFFSPLPDGPAPSRLYDFLKSVRNGSAQQDSLTFVSAKDVRINRSPDLDILSKSEIDCLDESISENKNLSYGQLKNKSHDEAYETNRNEYEISIVDMAKTAQASEEMLKYIELGIENERATY